jgi:hypothetical protein
MRPARDEIGGEVPAERARAVGEKLRGGIPERLCLTWKWSEEGKSMWAYRGRHVVGMVVLNTFGHWHYDLDAVSTKWITKGRGKVQNFTSAKRAVDRAWRDWLIAMDLV